MSDSDIDAAKIAAMKAAELGWLFFFGELMSYNY